MSRATGDVRALILPLDASQEDYVRLGQELGLDKPLPVQYATFLLNALQGDLGTSQYSHEEVTKLLSERSLSSGRLAGAASVLVLVIGIPAGIAAAVYRGRSADFGIKLFCLLGMSLPAFWLGLVLIQIFAVWLRWLPAGTDRAPTSIILPAITLAFAGIAGTHQALVT